MWGRKRSQPDSAKPENGRGGGLKEALQKARLDSAERTGIVVDLHDAEVARLELLSEQIAPLFEEVPAGIELFDPGLSRGETPRLWIDAIAHVAMGSDKRVYRFVQDTRYGRKVLAESAHIPEMVQAMTRYVAQRLIERERALVDAGRPVMGDLHRSTALERRRARRRAVRMFLLGVLAGVAGLVAAALLFGPR